MTDVLTVEIPEWAKDCNIRVMAGIELLAYRNRGGKLHVKTSRCNMCGECCKGFKEGRHVFPLTEDGTCIHLEYQGEQGICKLGVHRPFGCCVGTVNKSKHPYCTEGFEAK